MPLTIKKILGKKGLLSKAQASFMPRKAQQQMAEAIKKTLATKSQLVVEAGTGTGKTFGYLIPVFLSEKKTIISTGTKTLQDQLFFIDIPKIKTVLSSTNKIALLKGRGNYLCKYRIEKNLQDGRFSSPQLVSELHQINEWLAKTDYGDISEITFVSEDSAIWPFVTSTPDNCLGQECVFYKECFVVKARQKALEADIIIVNHHLFFADMALQQDGFGELLPGVEAIIFDEAHHLPDIISHFFSISLTSRQLIELTRDIETEILDTAKDSTDIFHITSLLQKTVHGMRLAFGPELRRAIWPEPCTPVLSENIDQIKNILKDLEEFLKLNAVRSKGLENCWRRSIQLIESFNMLTSQNNLDSIHWFETYSQSFTLQLTPLAVAEKFKEQLNREKKSWIFTSATLTVKDNFQLFVETLGLDSALTLQLKSPFDYQKQALLYVPRGLPDPRSYDFPKAMVEAIVPVLNQNRGRAFLLFTSYRVLEIVAEELIRTLSFPILLQGSMPKKELIERFKSLGNAILLGTSSFWYGVDIQGNTLSCVIIDKLPFAAPEDPILQARIRVLQKQGIDPFENYQLPNAVLALKQGAGRLIRDYKDSGILMICDPRIVGLRYGEAFLKSLPNMPRTRELEKVNQFIHETTKNETIST